MAEINLVHTDGKWVQNPHAFRFPDPESGTVFEPGQVYKIRYEPKSWIAKQMEAGTLVTAKDPMKAPPASQEPPGAA
jgi:hypothetical protein